MPNPRRKKKPPERVLAFQKPCNVLFQIFIDHRFPRGAPRTAAACLGSRCDDGGSAPRCMEVG